MLIIAIPKSASTSLRKTLGALHDFPTHQIYYKNAPIPSTMKFLYRYHTDIREINAAQATLFADDRQLYKQHIPPTENNLKLLRHLKKKVVLLRDPIEIIEAYFRADKRKLHSPRLEFRSCRNLQEWIKLAEQNGLLDDLKLFNRLWTIEADKFPHENLVVYYPELVLNTKFTINRIEKFFALPVSKHVSLKKERYSRHPFYYYHFRQIWKKLGLPS